MITGSNGLLGQKLTDKLRDNSDYQLIATSRGQDRYPVPQGYLYEELDITDQKQVVDCVSRHKPHVLIHTAAMTNVDACEKDKDNCRVINVEAVRFIKDAAEQNAVHLIHLSTDFVFNGKEGPYQEQDEPDPLSYYGWSKVESEKIVKKSVAPWTIIRTIIVYGVAAGMSRTNIVLWAKQALQKGEPIQVVNDQFRSPTLAEDLADACISAAQKQSTGVYHISGKDYMSVLELVKRVAHFFQLDASLIRPVKSETLNQAARRPPKTGFILTKAYDELEYRPHSFEEGLAVVDAQLKRAEFIRG